MKKWLIDASDVMYKMIYKLVESDVNDVRYAAGLRDAINIVKSAKNMAEDVSLPVEYESEMELKA